MLRVTTSFALLLAGDGCPIRLNIEVMAISYGSLMWRSLTLPFRPTQFGPPGGSSSCCPVFFLGLYTRRGRILPPSPPCPPAVTITENTKQGDLILPQKLQWNSPVVIHLPFWGWTFSQEASRSFWEQTAACLSVPTTAPDTPRCIWIWQSWFSGPTLSHQDHCSLAPVKAQLCPSSHFTDFLNVLLPVQLSAAEVKQASLLNVLHPMVGFQGVICPSYTP